MGATITLTPEIRLEVFQQVYDHFRTALLNHKYYGYRLTRIKNINLFLEIFIAVATSSTVAGWALWDAGMGLHIWSILGGLVSLIAIVKPFLGLGQKIKRYSDLHTSHAAVAYDLLSAANEARISGVQNETIRRLRAAEKRITELTEKDDPNPSQRLLDRCQDEVNAAVTPESIAVPTTILEDSDG